jgi:hypothetical protein
MDRESWMGDGRVDVLVWRSEVVGAVVVCEMIWEEVVEVSCEMTLVVEGVCESSWVEGVEEVSLRSEGVVVEVCEMIWEGVVEACESSLVVAGVVCEMTLEEVGAASLMSEEVEEAAF